MWRWRWSYRRRWLHTLHVLGESNGGVFAIIENHIFYP
jgi:hypothetical protein